MGPMTNVQDNLHHLTVNFVRSSEVMEDTQDLLMQQVERFWATETTGVETESKACMSLEDKKALRTMEQSVKLQDGHYQVALPWREFPPFLPYNRPLAERRLRMLKRRFLQDNELFKNYKGTMEKYLSDGHARRVPPEELHVKDRPLWYLPHHHVLNKPEKTRVVFDCAAKYRGTSLNDQLLTGPDLTNSILGVLTRFREDRVALSADIKCMFHQIRVPPADRDAFRFLWWPTGDLNQEAVDHRMEVHLFGATSSPSCSSFALRKTAEDNKEDFEEEVVKTVKRNFYVDDCLKSVKSVDCAIQIVMQLRDLLSKGGFRLTKWLSNNSKVLNFIPHEERAPSLLDLDLDKDKPPIQRALGLHWNMETDMFTFKVNLKEKPNTRRGILSLTSSLYDPLGLVAPIILPAKKLLQDLSKQKLGWDDPINDDDKERWEKWKNQLSGLPKIKVNRCFRPVGFGELKLVELHSFADASQVAYGAVCYLRLVDVNDRMHCAFLVGRSRLAHVRPMTVPRLELCAAVLAVQLNKLHPLLDEFGILRVGGRLENALISYEAKHPVVLPYQHHVTNLIISQHHQITCHLGQEYVLSSLRQHYWIIKGRSAVRRVLSKCFQCKKLEAPRGEQLMADLPKERLMSGEPPFTYVGVDYFGPFLVRQGRSNVKRYGCLFTCLVVRVVHIEVVHSLDTDSFINALRRFINSRGCPKTIYSDNGTNFHAGERELRESLNDWNQRSINQFLQQRKITWKFNPPAASHMGGVWERIIRSIRKILRALLGQQVLSDEMLQTLMSEIQGILNSRPLTPVSSDPKDLDPLTPNHLLLFKASPNLPPGSFCKEDVYSKRRWKQVQYMTDIFWKRWLKEYLPTLLVREKWINPRRCLTSGDLVLICDENVPRGHWPLGRVIEAHHGKDGYVRSVKVRTSSTILTRPVTKLCFLEEDRAPLSD